MTEAAPNNLKPDADLLSGYSGKRILEDEDRVLFDEATATAEVGAYRAAYILVWLSCAESLKRRFRVAQLRDGTAAKIYGDIERLEADQKSIDAFVLGKAKEYGLLDAAAHARLEHVYTMRCVYGHPYEKSPTREELVAAGSAVVDLVLAQPMKLRHGFMQGQVNLLTTIPAFLDDHQPAVEAYAIEILPRMDDSLLEWFIEKLWEAAEPFGRDASMGVLFRRVRWFSQALLSTSTATFENTDWRKYLAATPIISTAVMVDGSLFARLSPHAQDIAVGNVLELAQSATSWLGALASLDSQGRLSPRHRERLQAAADALPRRVLSTVPTILRYSVQRLIRDLKSSNWYAQNPAVEVLQSTGPSGLTGVSDTELSLLGNNVLQAADGNAGAAMTFLQSLIGQEEQWPAAFIEGIVTECFVNENNGIRFKHDAGNGQPIALCHLLAHIRPACLCLLATRISNGTVVTLTRSGRTVQDMLSIIDAALGLSPSNSDALQELRKVIAGLENQQNGQ